MPTRSLAQVSAPVWQALLSSMCLKQVVCVVDGPEHSAERQAAADLAARYSQWTWAVCYVGCPAGITAALNWGIERLDCPLTARQDDDDLSLPGRIDRQAAAFDEDPTLAVLGGALSYHRNGKAGIRSWPLTREAILRQLPYSSPFAHPTVMIRSKLLKQYKYSDFRYCEDYDLWIRLADTGNLANLPEPLVEYSIRSPRQLRTFAHGPVFRAHTRLKWQHRRLLAELASSAPKFYGLLASEILFSLLPNACFRWYYTRMLYP